MPDAPPVGTDTTETLGDPPKAESRTLHLAGRTCMLIVEAQGIDPFPPEADRRRFLASFKDVPR